MNGMSLKTIVVVPARMASSRYPGKPLAMILDLPMIETIIVEVPNPFHPFGVRGVGETPIVPALAAVANAVHDATGARFPQLPIKPGRILESLAARDGS